MHSTPTLRLAAAALGLSLTAPLASAADEAKTEFFMTQVKPLMEATCIQCHGPDEAEGDYRMDTIDGLFAAGDSELDPIVEGRPLESYLVEVISLPEEDDFVMPPTGKEALTGEEILAIMRWIWDGAETGLDEAVPKTSEETVTGTTAAAAASPE